MAARAKPWNLEPLIPRLAGICETLPEIIFFSRPDGYCEHLNSHFYDYTGLALHGAEGNAWEKIVHPDDRAPNWQRWLRSQSTGEPYALCNRLRCNNGEHRWFLSRSHPLRNREGRIILWVGISAGIEHIVDNYKKTDAEIRTLANLSPDFLYASEIAIRVNRVASLFADVLVGSGAIGHRTSQADSPGTRSLIDP